MKVLFLTLMLLGCALAEEKEEAEVAPLQEIEQDETARQDVGQTVTVQKVDLLDGLTQVLANPDKNGIDLGALPVLDLTTAVGAAITGVLGSLAAIKTALTGILLKPLGLAIDVLVIIALVLLIKYLVENKGDVKGLIDHSGYGGSGYDYSGSSSYATTGTHYRRSAGARSLFDTPAVQLLTNAVYDAIEKHTQ